MEFVELRAELLEARGRVGGRAALVFERARLRDRRVDVAARLLEEGAVPVVERARGVERARALVSSSSRAVVRSSACAHDMVQVVTALQTSFLQVLPWIQKGVGSENSVMSVTVGASTKFIRERSWQQQQQPQQPFYQLQGYFGNFFQKHRSLQIHLA